LQIIWYVTDDFHLFFCICILSYPTIPINIFIVKPKFYNLYFRKVLASIDTKAKTSQKIINKAEFYRGHKRDTEIMPTIRSGLMSAIAMLLISGFTMSDAQVSPPKKVLIVLTNHSQLGNTGKSTGFYLSEVSHPYEVFKRAGYQIDFVSPTGGSAPIDPKSYDTKDPLNRQFVNDTSVMAKVKDTLSPAQVNPNEYQAIFFAGGHGVMWDLPNNQPLMQLTASMYESGSVVGAVCHGPAALVNVKLANGEYLVAGKNVAAFTNEEEEAVGLTKVMPFLLESKLIKRGAKHTEAANFQPHVVASDRLVTGQNPASATGVAEKMVAIKETAKL
jgi:putative intracellular protease/amidase